MKPERLESQVRSDSRPFLRVLSNDRDPGSTQQCERSRTADIGSPEGGDVPITVDGRPVIAFRGESVLTVLAALDRRAIAVEEDGGRRGAWCGMGVCFACQALINGRLRRACVTPVANGMQVLTTLSADTLLGATAGAQATADAPMNGDAHV